MLEVNRQEVKYIISIKDFYFLRKYLECYIRPDENSGDFGYTVRSLYFDSINDKALHDVFDGLMEKRKIRLRIYSINDTSVKLEYKCKSGSDTRKLSLTIPKPEALRMAGGDYSFLLEKKEPLAVTLYSQLKTETYRPKIIVDYNRLAYAYMPNKIRITFDYNIKSSSITSGLFEQNLPWNPVMPPGIGVLEVKYNGFLFSHLQTAIEKLDLLPTSSSKYANSRLISNF